ncbi:MAG: RNA 2',3'-cyclic phosphodiesterase [Desulfuromonadales bacterium]|nr:RNA 2',3'-cyclic phosphodiesterase [Desulfuromonadales bacterium]NIR34377.1 RNA 2',3'-cyclic phosphodiesterase [Desulfuromonadales bacterium]NIS44343.1 RNA 2',3'-cyclic phosphodiesterase [Desulfuromonadales bacterium]
MAKTRTFLAIPLPEAVVVEISALQKQLKQDLPGVRWSRADNLHLTLRFFGDCSEEDLDKIIAAMVSVGALWSPFEATVAGLGAFPSLRRPRVFWIGLQGEDKLLSLHGDLEEGLAQRGFPKENRPFTPHLTLGRARGRIDDARSSLAPYQTKQCGTLPVDRLVLFASDLRPDGAVHRPLKTVYLGKDPGDAQTT